MTYLYTHTETIAVFVFFYCCNETNHGLQPEKKEMIIKKKEMSNKQTNKQKRVIYYLSH